MEDGAKGVGAFNAWFGRVRWGAANALAQAAKFICIGGVLGVLVSRVSSELSVLQEQT